MRRKVDDAIVFERAAQHRFFRRSEVNRAEIFLPFRRGEDRVSFGGKRQRGMTV